MVELRMGSTSKTNGNRRMRSALERRLSCNLATVSVRAHPQSAHMDSAMQGSANFWGRGA